MPLNRKQMEQLNEATIGYVFPAVYFDFVNGTEIRAENMAEVENRIYIQLASNEIPDVKYGLANVLYWGYAQIGYRGNRVDDFINKVTERQIIEFIEVRNDDIPTMRDISRIHMPQYSGVSFISKILMFLNPDEYCVLDQQLAKLRTRNSPKQLNRLVFRPNESQIRITNHNEDVYNGWRNEWLEISQKYYQGEHRVVDIERGFFNLVQQGDVQQAQAIYNAA